MSIPSLLHRKRETKEKWERQEAKESKEKRAWKEKMESMVYPDRRAAKDYKLFFFK